MKDTGLKDSFSNPIMDGTTILWEYQMAGIEINTKDGKKSFMGCYPGTEIREMKRKQTISYEIRKYSAGYFLDRPSGCGITGLEDKITCEVIKRGL